jgi:glycine dehydrogenase subunit 1
MADSGVLGGVPASRLWPSSDLNDILIIAATETNTDADIDALVNALEGALA